MVPRLRPWWSRLPASRRRLAVAGFALGVLLGGVQVYPGLGGVLPGPEAAPRAGVHRCSGDGTLTIATGNDVSAASFRGNLVEEWNQRHDPDAELVEISESTDEARAEMAAAAQSHRCDYEILLLDIVHIAEFARNGHIREITLADLGHKARDAFVEEVLDSVEVGDSLFAVPFAADAPLLFRRAGLPLPATWDQMKKHARTHGYAGQFDDYEGGTVNLMEALLSGGAEIVDEDGRVVLDEHAERTKQELGAVKGLLAGLQGDGGPASGGTGDAGAASRSDAGTSCQDRLARGCLLRFREESSLQAFRDGHAGYMRNWPYAYPRLALDPSMRDPDGALTFQVAPLPGAEVMGGHALAVSADVSEEDFAKAMELIKFFTLPESQEKLLRCGGYPPVIESVYTGYETAGTTAPEPCGATGPDQGGSAADPDAQMTLEQLRTFASVVHTAVKAARPRPRSAHYAFFSETFRACTRAAVTGGVNPEAVDVGRFAEALRAAQDGRRLNSPCFRPPDD